MLYNFDACKNSEYCYDWSCDIEYRNIDELEYRSVIPSCKSEEGVEEEGRHRAMKSTVGGGGGGVTIEIGHSLGKKQNNLGRAVKCV